MTRLQESSWRRVREMSQLIRKETRSNWPAWAWFFRQIGRIARMFDNLPKMAYSYETCGASHVSWRRRIANLFGGDLWRSELFGKST